MITPADSAPEPPAQMPASSFDIIAPYERGPEGHVQVHGDADPGGSDKISPTVDGAVAAAMGRQADLERDTFGVGSVIGDIMAIPASLPLDPGVGSLGEAIPTGSYYDPPRDY